MHRRSILLRLAALVAIAVSALALPAATSACSCAMPGPMAEVRGDPEIAVFSGVVDPQDARGYPVTITRWFQGGGIVEPRIWFTASSFSGDDASCGVAPLPIATEWIFVAYRTEGMYGTGLCSPHAAVATADGQAMLADAIQTFGGAQPNATDPPTAPSPSTVPSEPSPGAGPSTLVSVVETVAPIALAIFGLGVVIGVVGVLRRTRPRGD
jgi:hypothetical protein